MFIYSCTSYKQTLVFVPSTKPHSERCLHVSPQWRLSAAPVVNWQQRPQRKINKNVVTLKHKDSWPISWYELAHGIQNRANRTVKRYALSYPMSFVPMYSQKDLSLSTSIFHSPHSDNKGRAKLGGVNETHIHFPPGRNTRTRLRAMRGKNQSNASEHAMASRVPLSTAAWKALSGNSLLLRLQASATSHLIPGRSVDSGFPCAIQASEKSILVILRHPESYILLVYALG